MKLIITVQCNDGTKEVSFFDGYDESTTLSEFVELCAHNASKGFRYVQFAGKELDMTEFLWVYENGRHLPICFLNKAVSQDEIFPKSKETTVNGPTIAGAAKKSKTTKKKDVVLKRVNKIVSEQLGIRESELKSDSSISTEYGADSLDQVEFVLALEDEFGIEIADEETDGIDTIDGMVDLIKRKNWT